MGKPVLEMNRLQDGRILVQFIAGNGSSAYSHFNAPSSDIDHADGRYINGRFWNARHWTQHEFIKREYKKLYKGLFGGE
ncbi:hypothetical protein [Bacillus phage BC-T25]|nr:hypothetical protein [Bacillus phage BC-T25]